MVTGSHTPTSYQIHMRSMPAVYIFQPLFSLLVQIDNSRKLRSRGIAKESASWDAGSPFLVIILRRGWSRCDGRQRDAGSGGRVFWPMKCISTRGTPRRWLHLGMNKDIRREYQHTKETRTCSIKASTILPVRPSFRMPFLCPGRCGKLLSYLLP